MLGSRRKRRQDEEAVSEEEDEAVLQTQFTQVVGSQNVPDAAERRRVRKHYRTIIEETETHKEEFTKPDCEGLHTQLSKADELYEKGMLESKLCLTKNRTSNLLFSENVSRGCFGFQIPCAVVEHRRTAGSPSQGRSGRL